MKKLILTVLFLVLLGFTVYYFIYRKGSTIDQTEKQFALSEISAVDRVVLQQGDQRIILQKRSQDWLVNNKDARSDLVRVLIGVSAGLDAVAPVAKHDRDSVNLKMKTGILVRFYRGNNELNAFTLCKYNNTIYGLREKSKNSYKITLRGFSTIDLTRLFSTNENYWLTNLLISFVPEKINYISINYPANPKMGFIMERSADGSYKVTNKGHGNILTDTDPEIIAEYLYFFGNIRYYPVDDSTGLRMDILSKKNEFFQLKIENIDGRTVEVQGYTKPGVENEQIDPVQFYALASNDNIILLKYNDFDPILVHADYFLKK